MFSEEIIRNSVAFSATIVIFGLMVWLFFNDRGGGGNGMIHCMVSEKKKTSLSIRLLEETTRADVVIVVLYRRWFILQH